MDPLLGLRDAVLREWRAHEALDLQAALEALTVTPAWLRARSTAAAACARACSPTSSILDRDPFDDLEGARVVDTLARRVRSTVDA